MTSYRTSHGRELEVRPVTAVEPTVEVEGITGEKLAEMVRDFNYMALDLKTALELIRQYQSHLNRLCGPDPSAVEANKLMRKYDMPLADLRQLPFRIYVDGIDITEHPDSIPGSVAVQDELESGDEEIIDAVEVKELESGS